MADLIMDRLPLHQRNAVLQAMYQGEDVDISPQGQARRPSYFRAIGVIAILIPIVFLWALPLMLVGMLLCLTVVLAPVGLLLMTLGSSPINHVVGRISAEVS